MDKSNFYISFWVVVFVCFLQGLQAQRVQHSINSGWQFLSKGDPLQKKVSVSIPHTWNDKDATDEVPGYFRGMGVYEKRMIIPENQRDKQVVLHFKGANQVSELFVNNKSVGKHIGGYTQFAFDITPHVFFGKENLIEVRINNAHHEDIPPLSADFTFFGGIYRDVYIKYLSKLHISPLHYASGGVYIETPKVDSNAATVRVTTHLTNKDSQNRNLKLVHEVLDPSHKLINSIPFYESIKREENKVHRTKEIQIKNPQLWSPANPRLYTLVSKLVDTQTNQIVDEVVSTFGLCWFSFSANQGFFLNGRHLKLIGTNRHQDYKNIGNALSDDMHIRDVLLLKQMGGNFLRVSHYPQDPVVMDMCDKLGIITSVEIPVVNAITPSEAFTANTMHMLKEMVYQDFNRPSVMIWCYMNEVLLRPPMSKETPEYTGYIRTVEKLARQLEDTLKSIDPARATMIPFHGSWREYEDAGLHKIPDILGGNIYRGWYSGSVDDFGKVVDDLHKNHPGKAIMISEYGADADPRLHSFEPERFDYTAEYAALYHRAYLKVIEDRKFIAGATIWNLNDFYSEAREYAVPNINNKGITGIDRELKDGYLLYSAYLRKDPYVAIGMQHWKYRGGYADSFGTTRQSVTVYSNKPKVELFLNGKSIGMQNVKDYNVVFDVPFVNGEQRIEVFASDENNKRLPGISDAINFRFQQIPYRFTNDNFPVAGIHIMLGSRRYFEDRDAQVIWLPEQPCRKGSLGYDGGAQRRQPTRHGSLPASDSDIKGTQLDGVFQTQRSGIRSFRADVPDGLYTIELFFAELDMATTKEALAYNLGNDATASNIDERIFSISINNQPLGGTINLAKEYGPATLASIKTTLYVKNGEGMIFRFLPQEGDPVINAIRINKQH